MDEELRQQFKALATLIEGVKESLEREITGGKASLEREIGTVKERIDRMDARLGKIAAGAHYVTRLAEWSEKQDVFQLDILHRVQALETRVNKLQDGAK
jgi:hypothetical protein